MNFSHCTVVITHYGSLTAFVTHYTKETVLLRPSRLLADIRYYKLIIISYKLYMWAMGKGRHFKQKSKKVGLISFNVLDPLLIMQYAKNS